MAKKARRKTEGDEVERGFEFPTFDEPGFLRHEFEQSYATGIAIALAVVFGLLSYLVARIGAPAVVPILLGIALIANSPYVIQRLRRQSSEYTKGDWAGLILTEGFGWLGFWFLFSDVLPH